MAHIGKNYKLLFRRDICLNCTNYRFAFPEAWMFSCALVSSNPENLHWNLNNVLLRPIDPPETSRPRWESEALFQHQVSFKVIAEFDGYTPLQGLTHIVIRFHTGSHYWLESVPVQFAPGRCDSYRYDTFGQGSLIVLDPTIFGGATGTGQLVIFAARWQQWPA